MIIKNLFRQVFNVSVCSTQQKILVIACAFDIMQFDNMLQKFLIAVIAVHVITNENYRTFQPSGIFLSVKVNNKLIIETLEQGVKYVQS